MVSRLTCNASVTIATAAVDSKISTANSNYRVAAEFPRSHTVAVTYVTVAARRIFNFMETENLRLPYVL